MGRFGKERVACPLLLAASAPEATVDRSLYTPPALRFSPNLTHNLPGNAYFSAALQQVLSSLCSFGPV